MTGIELIAQERQRQIEKGFDAPHDDSHDKGEIAEVAEVILHTVNNPLHPVRGMMGTNGGDPNHPDNWHMHIIQKWRHDPVRMLTIAAAMIAAEIDRLNRLNKARLAAEDASSNTSSNAKDNPMERERCMCCGKETTPSDSRTLESFGEHYGTVHHECAKKKNAELAGTPARRSNLLGFTTAEWAIWYATKVVESAGCSTRLTDAVILLGQAREKVADFVDQPIDPDPSHSPIEPTQPTDLQSQKLHEVLEAHRRFHAKVGCPGLPECPVCAMEERNPSGGDERGGGSQ